MKYIREVVTGVVLGLLVFAAVLGVNVLPFMFTVALLYMFTRAMPGARGGFGGPAVKFGGAPSAPAVKLMSFDEIGGQASAKRELVEALDFITDQEKAKRLGIRPLKGILLTGPPGTGKTLLAKAAAGYTNSVLLTAAGSEFIEMNWS